MKVNPYLSLEKIDPGVSLMIDEASLLEYILLMLGQKKG